MNLLAFVVWLPLVHRKFAPGLNARWYFNDIAVIVAPSMFAAYVASSVLPPGGPRPNQFAHIMLAGIVSLLVGAAASSAARAKVRAFWRTPSLQQP